MDRLTYFSTFSGIGGFELGIEKAAKLKKLPNPLTSTLNVWATLKSTNSQRMYINIISKGIKTMETLPKSTQTNCQTSTSLSVASPAKATALPAKGGDFRINAGNSSLTSSKLFPPSALSSLSSKMSKHSLAMQEGELSPQSYIIWQKWGSMWNGAYVTAHILAFPKSENVLSSLDFLEQSPDNRYFRPTPLSKHVLMKLGLLATANPVTQVKLKTTSNTIIANYRGLGNFNQPAILTDDKNIRRLTPLECERLQGFPDNWTKLGASGKTISDSQRYHQCGNAVCPNVVEYVFKQIFNSNFLFDDF